MRIQSGLSIVLACCGLAACSSAEETPEQPDSDEAAIHAELTRIGFDATGAVSDDNYVVVNGDIVFERAALLNGEYQPVHPRDGLIEKAYTVGSKVKQEWANELTLYSDRAGPTLGNSIVKPELMEPIYDAMSNSAFEWSGTGSRITIGREFGVPDNGEIGIAITTYVVYDDDWNDGSWGGPPGCNREASGCASWPKNGLPGSVWINLLGPDHHSTCTWNEKTLHHVMTHEFGHALGFTHPGDGTLIAGTCDVSAGCSSVMEATFPLSPAPACTTTSGGVTRDDIDAAQVLYPSEIDHD